MAEEEERVYTIPLRKVWSVPRTQRAPRAIRAVREFVGQHMKARTEDVWVDPRLNEILWARGREKPPRRVQVKVIKLEDETVEVSPLIPEVAEEEEEPEGKKGEEPAEEGAEEPTERAVGEGGEVEAREPPGPQAAAGAEGGGKKTAAKPQAKPRGRGKSKAKAPGRGEKKGKGKAGRKKR